MTITKEEADQFKTYLSDLSERATIVGRAIETGKDFSNAVLGRESVRMDAIQFLNSLTDKPPAPLLSEQIEALPIGTTFTLKFSGSPDRDIRVRVENGYINSRDPQEVYGPYFWDSSNATLEVLYTP